MNLKTKKPAPRRFTNLAPKKAGRYGKDKRFTNALGSWDSGKEYERFLFLQDLEKKGTITDLERNLRFVFKHNGVRICAFKVDFGYRVDGVRVVEDYKGNVIHRDFKLRVKMLKAFEGLDVVIVQEVGDMTPINNVRKETRK